MTYQPRTGKRCHCRPGVARDNCPDCEGTGWRIDFPAIRAATQARCKCGHAQSSHEGPLSHGACRLTVTGQPGGDNPCPCGRFTFAGRMVTP